MLHVFVMALVHAFASRALTYEYEKKQQKRNLSWEKTLKKLKDRGSVYKLREG
jgi:hypothetical protein